MFSFFSGFITGLLTAIGLLVWLAHYALTKKGVAEYLKGLCKPEPLAERKAE
jgi:hypothetical protein